MPPYQTARFDPTAGPAAAEGYPREVVAGQFSTTGEGGSIVVSPDFLEGEWDLSATTYVSGDGTSPAPDSLQVRWYSYPEDKFYEGQWAMPQRRIYDLLKQGCWNPRSRQRETYAELTVCFLTKGGAVVWLTGANQVLLGRYEGREIDFDFKLFHAAANRPRMVAQEQAKLPPQVQQEISPHTLSPRRWDRYLLSYPWQLAFSRPVQLKNYEIAYLNAERTICPTTSDLAAYPHYLLTPQVRPVPKDLLLAVDTGYGRQRNIRVDVFDETETLAAFQALHAAQPAAPVTLLVETNERMTQVRFFVKNDYQAVPLTKVKLAIYEAK